ncbi:MAG: HAMP domain-containing histidine kinase [Nitrospirae bacterium]|nr:HAMP domain-containing histidine kinase [Nitrospirota bacterium]
MKASFIEYLRTGENQNKDVVRLVAELINYRASQKDEEIKNVMLKKLVMQYSESERKLVELNDLKNKFLGIAAHDLRNPLASIRGFAELMIEGATGQVNEEQKEFLSIIHDTASRMLSLLNNLLDVSVIESGRFELRLQKASLKELVSKSVRLNKMAAEGKGISIVENLSDVPEAEFDPERITQVVDNLLSNAAKFSPAGSTVTVTLREEGGNLYMGVRDEGPGISAEDKVKLFGEFQKLSARPTGGEKSTGLGLAIVKKIIQAHGGDITVESHPGSGAEFIFSIPIGGTIG